MADHCFGGNAVLPTVCATHWMVSVCEDLYPGYRFFAYDNYRLYKGIVFDGNQSDLTKMDVEETSVDGNEVKVSIKVWSNNAKGFRINHYAAELTLLRQIPEAPKYEAFDKQLVSASVVDSAQYSECYSNGTLFHGASFQSIRESLLESPSQLTLRCSVPSVSSETQGQFIANSTNPFVDDVLYQAMLVWVRNNSGKGSLPSSAKRYEQFSTIPANTDFYLSLDVVSNKSTNMVANVTLHSAEGTVYMRMQQAEVTISEALNPLFLQSTVESPENANDKVNVE